MLASVPHGPRVVELPPQLIIFQVTPRLGTFGSPLAFPTKVSEASSIVTLVNVEVIAPVMVEVNVNPLLVAGVSAPEEAVNV